MSCACTEETIKFGNKELTLLTNAFKLINLITFVIDEKHVEITLELS